MPEKLQYKYQDDFSHLQQDAMYDSERRQHKARKTMAVIQDYLSQTGKDARDLSLLDIGCSTGYMSQAYGQYFGQVTGIDIDQSAVEHAIQKFSSGTVKFFVKDSMNTGLAERSFDVVTCTQIYEHVPDSTKLMSEIYRVLKPGGICYFAAGNRLQLIEPHYRLPLLSVIPKWLANYYIRWAGRAESYYETHLSYWGLRRLVREFDLFDYTLKVIRNPAKYSATEMVREGSLKQKLALGILVFAYWVCPGYIWILRRPL